MQSPLSLPRYAQVHLPETRHRFRVRQGTLQKLSAQPPATKLRVNVHSPNERLMSKLPMPLSMDCDDAYQPLCVKPAEYSMPFGGRQALRYKRERPVTFLFVAR